MLDLSQIKVILGDNEAQVNQVTQTFRDARLIHTAHSDPHFCLVQHVQILLDLGQILQKMGRVAQVKHHLFTLVLDQIADVKQLFDFTLVLKTLLQV